MSAETRRLDDVAGRAANATTGTARRDLYLEARRVIRAMAFRNPLLDFKDLLFVKRAPGQFSHMSDQNYGWWSRPGGGIYILKDFRSNSPTLVCLTPGMETGSFQRPDLSYDAKRIVFAWCRYYPEHRGQPEQDRQGVAARGRDPGLPGAQRPLRVYLICYQALRAAGDARGDAVIEQAYRSLMDRAARLQEDSARRSFLQNIPVHREITQAFQRIGERHTNAH